MVELKAEYKHPAAGLQQAMQYAQILGVNLAIEVNCSPDLSREAGFLHGSPHSVIKRRGIGSKDLADG